MDIFMNKRLYSNFTPTNVAQVVMLASSPSMRLPASHSMFALYFANFYHPSLPPPLNNDHLLLTFNFASWSKIYLLGRAGINRPPTDL